MPASALTENQNNHGDGSRPGIVTATSRRVSAVVESHDALGAVVNSRYDKVRDVVELVFRSGKVVAIPRALLPGLKGARVSTPKGVSVSPAGDAISWRTKDIDFSVRGLLKRARESASPRRVGLRACRLDWRRPSVTRLSARASSCWRTQPRLLSTERLAERLSRSASILPQSRTSANLTLKPMPFGNSESASHKS